LSSLIRPCTLPEVHSDGTGAKTPASSGIRVGPRITRSGTGSCSSRIRVSEQDPLAKRRTCCLL